MIEIFSAFLLSGIDASAFSSGHVEAAFCFDSPNIVAHVFGLPGYGPEYPESPTIKTWESGPILPKVFLPMGVTEVEMDPDGEYEFSYTNVAQLKKLSPPMENLSEEARAFLAFVKALPDERIFVLLR